MGDRRREQYDNYSTEQHEHVSRLVGKTIESVHVETQYGRTQKLRLLLSDGTEAVIDHWAAYADDSGLEIEIGGQLGPGAVL
jgi:hypothetical protein